MGNPAYDARREAERVEAEKEKAAAEAAKAAFEGITDFFTGKARLIVEPIDSREPGRVMVTFSR
jgi:hypothetical protein